MQSPKLEEDSPDQQEPQPQEEPDFPKAVYFIVGNEFCERFSFYGMRTVLFVYLTTYLQLSETKATVGVHLFTMLAYFFPLVGGVLGDSYLGKYNTILYLSLIYCVGNLVLSVTAIPYLTGNPPQVWGAALGLLLLAIGTGGIKSNVGAFGADQFQASQVSAIQRFFSLFYFSINAGSLLSTFVTPELRALHCFGLDSCFPLAFGIPAILMVVATIIFMVGGLNGGYKKVPPGDNVLFLVVSVVYCALRNKQELQRPVSAEVLLNSDDLEMTITPSQSPVDQRPSERSWLDPAVNKYGEGTVNQVKSVLSVLYMFLPLPFFWTLYDQTASRWVAQAKKMDQHIGPWNIKYDQMQLTNALLILVMIPLFEQVIYPFLEFRLRVKLKQLTRMTIGMILVGGSFLMAGFIQFAVDKGEFDKDGFCTSNCTKILWQVPQYVVLTAGEIMFSITGLEFAYSQSPKKMKAVLQACWLLTVAAGNLIVVLVAEASFFEQDALEYLFFAGLIFAAALVFAMMSLTYTYKKLDDDDDQDDGYHEIAQQ